MKISICLVVGVIVTSFSIATFADVSPTKTSASNITPVNATGIKMVSAKVDIDWGIPCSLSAVFMLDNETASPIEIQLGFPMELPFDPNANDLGFTIAFNDNPATNIAVSQETLTSSHPYKKITWFHCRQIFNLGQTKVVIKSKFPASLVYYLPYRESLCYYMQTGSHWKGNIGYEEVNINFPDPLSREQISEISPGNYIINGNSVRWQFKDFEPNAESDIHIQYLRPDVFNVLSDLRAKHLQDPTDPNVLLSLTKHLFALGPGKGYAGFPPGHLSKSEYAELVNKFKNHSEGNLAFFESRYALTEDGWYKEKSSEWTKDRELMVRLLNEINYEPEHAKSLYVDEAKRLLDDLLKKQPQNAEAWNIYLANYYRFRFGGINPGAAVRIEYEHQVNLIKQAHANCPEDPYIALWYQRCSQFDNNHVLLEALDKTDVFHVDYKDVDYGYY